MRFLTRISPDLLEKTTHKNHFFICHILLNLHLLKKTIKNIDHENTSLHK